MELKRSIARRRALSAMDFLAIVRLTTIVAKRQSTPAQRQRHGARAARRASAVRALRSSTPGITALHSLAPQPLPSFVREIGERLVREPRIHRAFDGVLQRCGTACRNSRLQGGGAGFIDFDKRIAHGWILSHWRSHIIRQFRRCHAATAHVHAAFRSSSGVHWPKLASPFMRARCANAACALAMLAALPAQAFCGAACSARP